MNDDASLISLDTLRERVLAMPMAQTLGLRFDALARGEVTLSAPVDDAVLKRTVEAKDYTVTGIA